MGLGDVYKRQPRSNPSFLAMPASDTPTIASRAACGKQDDAGPTPVSYTHLDAADERSSVDLGGRRIIKKKKQVAAQRG